MKENVTTPPFDTFRQETVDRQGLVSHLTDALLEMQQTATAYTSKAALGTLLVWAFVRRKASVAPGLTNDL